MHKAKFDFKFNRGLLSWCLYDWANSAFVTVIITFVFSAYFTKAVAPDEITGTSLWGYASSISAATVALLAPLIGAIADQTGRRKPWILLFTALCVVATALLWYAYPDSSTIYRTLLCVILATIGFEFGMVFYNAMLPEIIDDKRIGRLSGWAWGLGFFGGLVALLLSLIGFVQTKTPWFGFGTENAENIRAIALLISAWFCVFSVPLFLFTPDREKTGTTLSAAIKQGLKTLAQTLLRAREYKTILRYLVIRMIYSDGLNTLFAFGGIYAAGSFGMKLDEVILFGIALNVTAGLGAIAFAWLDDYLGAKKVILISLSGLILLGSIMLVVENKTLFWAVGLGLGVFIGPVQAASRSLMARITPQNMRAEFFGLYALSGKATAFLGPLILAILTDYFDSQRIGMASIIVFFLLGLFLLWPMKFEQSNA